MTKLSQNTASQRFHSRLFSWPLPFLSLHCPGQPPCGAVPSPQLPGALGSGGGICGHLSLWSHPVAALLVCPSPPPATPSLSWPSGSSLPMCCLSWPMPGFTEELVQWTGASRLPRLSSRLAAAAPLLVNPLTVQPHNWPLALYYSLAFQLS